MALISVTSVNDEYFTSELNMKMRFFFISFMSFVLVCGAFASTRFIDFKNIYDEAPYGASFEDLSHIKNCYAVSELFMNSIEQHKLHLSKEEHDGGPILGQVYNYDVYFEHHFFFRSKIYSTFSYQTNFLNNQLTLIKDEFDKVSFKVDQDRKYLFYSLTQKYTDIDTHEQIYGYCSLQGDDNEL